MILFVQIAIAIRGLAGLLTGRIKITKNKVLYDTLARIVGAAGLIQLPLAFGLGLAVGGSIRSSEAIDGFLPFLFVVQLILLAAPFILGACLDNSPERNESVHDRFHLTLALLNRQTPYDLPFDRAGRSLSGELFLLPGLLGIS